MKHLTIIAILALSACAPLTGNQPQDCLAAQNAANTARAASILARAIATSNPQSDRMQQAADLADAALVAAEANVAAACDQP